MLLGPKSVKSNTAKITIGGRGLKSPSSSSAAAAAATTTTSANGASRKQGNSGSNLSTTSSSTTGNGGSSTATSTGANTAAPSITPARRTVSSLSTTSSLSSSTQYSNQTTTTTNNSNNCQKLQQSRRQTSQSSLLHSGAKSTSRSSIASDTTASVCSSSLNVSKNVTPKSSTPSLLLRPKSSSSTTNKQPAGKNTTRTILNAHSNNIARKSGPSSTGGNSSSSTSSGYSHSTSSSSSASTSTATSTPTSTSTSTSNSSARRVPTLAMSLRDKDQQIKLLIKERDEQKFQAELMTKRAEEWEEKFLQSELEKSHVTSEADDEVIELRRLTQELEDENKKLLDNLSKSEQLISDIQFKIDELECEKSELRKELGDKMDELKMVEREQSEIASGKPVKQIETERSISRAKYEREIEELKEKILNKDEQMIQLRTSLEMRKNEVNNLQKHSGDLERKLKIECERSDRHLKRIDEVNLEFKAVEAKLSTKLEENEMYEKQVKQLRQDLRSAEDKLEQISLARKKDVDILHNKLSVARRGSTTPTSPQPYKTPTPQDEIVRLQMEIRDLKDHLIDREAELDCNKRDMEVLRKKMETRTLEVDCNNQELARRCQDLLEQNRQSEDTIKQLLKSTTEHSTQLLRATEDLKEANGKCIKLRDEINELELKYDEQLKRSNLLLKENSQLKDDNEEYKEQVEILHHQIDSLNERISELCDQLDLHTNNLHKNREALANQLSQNEIDSAQMKHDLDRARQDLRTNKLHTQEVANERDMLRSEIVIKEKYILSRNDIIETMRHELDDCKKSLADYKIKIEKLREESHVEADKLGKDMKNQLDNLKRECQSKSEEGAILRARCEQLEREKLINEEDELKKFDEMRKKHSIELDELRIKLKELEDQLEEAKSSTLKREPPINKTTNDVDEKILKGASQSNNNKREDYETQIEFLNCLVVDMQRKCDDYRDKLDTLQIVNEFENLTMSSRSSSRASTLKRSSVANNQAQSQVDGFGAYTLSKSGNFGNTTTMNNNNNINTNSFMDNKALRISGRPHCDICNIFDSHHTVFCPKRNHEKLVTKPNQTSATNGTNNNNNNNNNNCNNAYIEDFYREYEQSLKSASTMIKQFSSLRRPQNVEKPASRPYCDY